MKSRRRLTLFVPGTRFQLNVSRLFMIKHLIVAAIVAASAATVFPAFASGYGPAPHYNALDGAPASQGGPSALTVGAEQVGLTASADITAHSYGGMHDMASQSGAHVVPNASLSLYSHH
jgi:hypothetical protein